MGGKKRSREKSYDEVLKKIRKLEKQVKKNRVRLPSTSSSSCTEESREIPQIDTSADIHLPSDEIAHPLVEEDSVENPSAVEDPPALEEVNESENISQELELNQDVLDLLGGDPLSEKIFDVNIQKDVAKIWTHVLLNGLSKEHRAELIKTYLPPENCNNMRAPKLNPEIKAALTEINNKKDAHSQAKQNQLASCLAALAKALNIAVSSDIPQNMIKLLSDTGRLLCDYHYKESQSRRYAIINTLNKQTKDTIKNTKVDEFLFGSDLSEQLKSSKAISKSGMELRPPASPQSLAVDNRNRPKQSSSFVQPYAPAARRGALNARGTGRAIAAEPRASRAPRQQPAATAPRDRSYRSAPPPPPLPLPPRYRSTRRY